VPNSTETTTAATFAEVRTTTVSFAEIRNILVPAVLTVASAVLGFIVVLH